MGVEYPGRSQAPAPRGAIGSVVSRICLSPQRVTPLGPASGQMLCPTIEAQTWQMLEILRAALGAGRLDLEDIRATPAPVVDLAKVSRRLKGYGSPGLPSHVLHGPTLARRSKECSWKWTAQLLCPISDDRAGWLAGLVGGGR